MISGLYADCRYAIRAARRSPSLSVTVIVVVALTVGAAATWYGLLQAVVFRDLPVSEASRLVVLQARDTTGRPAPIYGRVFDQFAADQEVFDSLSLYAGGGEFTVVARGVLARARIEATSPEYFQLLRLRPHAGRFYTSDDVPKTSDSPPIVVLGHRFWSTFYAADAAALGETLVVNQTPLTIVGVMSERFVGLDTDSGADFYVPIGVLNNQLGNPQGPLRAQRIVARLGQGIEAAQATAQVTRLWSGSIKSVSLSAVPEAERRRLSAQTIHMESLRHGLSSFRTRYAGPLVMLTALSMLLLLVACANVGALVLTRTIANRHNIAVHQVMGATTWRVVRRLTVETAVPCLLGALAGVLVASWATRAVAVLMWTNMSPLVKSVTPDTAVLVVLCGIALGVTVLASAPSAAAAWRFTINSHARTTTGIRYPARMLLVLQVALSLVLLTAATLFASSLGNLQSVHSFDEPSRLLWTRLVSQPGGYEQLNEGAYYADLEARLREVPGVSSVALAHRFPTYFGVATTPTTEVRHQAAIGDESVVDAVFDYVSTDYFDTIGLSIEKGRPFTLSDRMETRPVAVVNRALEARLFGTGTAVGREIRVDSTSVEVVGVVQNAPIGSIREPDAPTAFRPRTQEPRYSRVPVVLLRVETDDEAVRDGVDNAVRAMGREYVRRIYTLDEQISLALVQERLLAAVSGGCAALAGGLALLGLCAMLTHSVTARRREIGVRMALGASRWRVVGMILGDGMALVLTGMAIGVPLAWWTGRSVQSLLYGVETSAPGPAARVAVLFLASALIALWVPAICASRILPADAFRD